jgi:hypothetical protein
MSASPKLKSIGQLILVFSGSLTVLLTVYIFLPYGNHLQAAWAVDSKISADNFYYSQAASKIVLKMRGIDCDAPVFVQDSLFNYHYYDYKKSAISQILGLYDIKKDLMNQEQEKFILQHLYKTIEKCDPNIELANLSPLMQVITSNNPKPDFLKSLILRGADVNQRFQHPTKPKSYTPLYFAELSLLKSPKTEEGKQALTKIIELLKQAGAKSEMTEILTK